MSLRMRCLAASKAALKCPSIATRVALKEQIRAQMHFEGNRLGEGNQLREGNQPGRSHLLIQVKNTNKMNTR